MDWSGSLGLAVQIRTLHCRWVMSSSLLTVLQVFSGVELTVGSDDDPAAQAINAMGGKHIQKKVNVSYPLMSCMLGQVTIDCVR